ncbi:hypothetical protein Z043_104190 [Scleropages formosus]|uniref:HAP1 N-terminal domain-containing protein n=1 Tax=Scleropages formosus TaxID=113540 RepID=A0A0P7XIJ0_SCLFO|nr:hypothetical protein Z043_104190 [Scleropages formosus]
MKELSNRNKFFTSSSQSVGNYEVFLKTVTVDGVQIDIDIALSRSARPWKSPQHLEDNSTVKLSHQLPSRLPALRPLPAFLDSWGHPAHHGDQTQEVAGSNPLSLTVAPTGGAAKRHFRDVSTLTDLCYSANLPEVEILSLLTEELPAYTLRADCVFGYTHDDWLHTPLFPPDAVLCLTDQQIEETLRYFCEFQLCSLLSSVESSCYRWASFLLENNMIYGSVLVYFSLLNCSPVLGSQVPV